MPHVELDFSRSIRVSIAGRQPTHLTSEPVTVKHLRPQLCRNTALDCKVFSVRRRLNQEILPVTMTVYELPRQSRITGDCRLRRPTRRRQGPIFDREVADQVELARIVGDQDQPGTARMRSDEQIVGAPADRLLHIKHP